MSRFLFHTGGEPTRPKTSFALVVLAIVVAGCRAEERDADALPLLRHRWAVSQISPSRLDVLNQSMPGRPLVAERFPTRGPNFHYLVSALCSIEGEEGLGAQGLIDLLGPPDEVYAVREDASSILVYFYTAAPGHPSDWAVKIRVDRKGALGRVGYNARRAFGNDASLTQRIVPPERR